ncbi:hypothetical protein AGR1A_Lc80244 [Agrobacterium fabacearum CFBP 5771]|nr:hypothetical protein AGR1A_Lc80244 [Agrobacterium fabacearum CFBP 5771]
MFGSSQLIRRDARALADCVG